MCQLTTRAPKCKLGPVARDLELVDHRKIIEGMVRKYVPAVNELVDDANGVLSEFAIGVDDSFVDLKDLVMHEVAHIVNDFPQGMKANCDLWRTETLKRS